MKETGILFTPENIRAVREGRKTQTRRVIREVPTYTHFKYCDGPKAGQPKPIMEWDLSGVWQDDDGRFWLDVQTEVDDNSHEELHCPQGVPGDRLYIKEGIIVYEDALEVTQLSGYYMDGYRVTKPDEKRLTAIFMPKRMARTWLELTDVRVERLQDISEEDAIAEGIGDWTAIGGWNAETAVEAYHKLWDSINKKKHPWTNNDWVWVLTFREVPA